MTTRHRKCGCDCNDQTRWVEDTDIVQATFDCGCADGKKPPCVYYANFECPVRYVGNGTDIFPGDSRYLDNDFFSSLFSQTYVRGVPSYTEQLRPTCKWGPAGRYVSFRSFYQLHKIIEQDGTNWTPVTSGAVGLAVSDGSCTWDDIVGFGSALQLNDDFGYGIYGRHPRNWGYMEKEIRWTLKITDSPVTMTHYGGATYIQKPHERWDCFGPNTLWLDKDPLEYTEYTLLPTFVCITPSVYQVKNKPTSCDKCYGMTFPGASFYFGSIPKQKVEFLKSLIEDGSLIVGAAAIQNDLYNENLFHIEQAPILLKTTTHPYFVEFGPQQFLGGRTFITLRFLDAISVENPVRAEIRFPFNGNAFNWNINNAGPLDEPVYYSCERFFCGESNAFILNSYSGDRGGMDGWPRVLTLDPQDCTRSDQYQWGPCWTSDGLTIWEAGYPSGESEESRKNCCDPWCSCTPGWLKAFNPSGSHLYQSFGGLITDQISSNVFCAGGRYGLNSPSNISREWCLPTVYAADGTAHQICMVLYCGSLGGGVTWLIDWYCDGAFVATRNMNQVLNCCPNQMAQTGPEMPCLPGAVLCVGINVEPACSPPPPPCCNLSDYQSTLTLSMYTTGCSGWPATVTLTRSGSVFSGSFSVGGNAVLVTFDCVNPINGVDCGLKFLCSATGANQTGKMTSTTCSPPTLTGTVNLGLTFGCSCGVFATVLSILNTP